MYQSFIMVKAIAERWWEYYAARRPWITMRRAWTQLFLWTPTETIAFRPILHIEHVLTVPSFSFSYRSSCFLQLASLSSASSIYTKTFAAFVWAMLVDAVNVSPTEGMK